MQKRGYHYSPLKIFSSHSSEKLRRRTILCFKKFWYRKFSCIGGGHHGFVEHFLSHRTEKLRKASLLCFKKFWYRKFSCIGEGEGGITVLSKKVLSQDRKEKLGEGTLLCSRKFLVSKKFYAWDRERGGLSRFCSVKSLKYLTRQRFEPVPTASERCFPNPTAHIYFWNKSRKFWTKKKEKRVTVQQGRRRWPKYSILGVAFSNW